MSRASNLGRADNFLAGRAFAHNAPFNGSRPGILMSHLCVLQYGGGRSKQGWDAPAAKAANNICLSQAKLTAGSLNINGALATDGVATISPSRNLRIVSSSAGDTTQVATITGLDAAGNSLTEQLTFNGTNIVTGSQCFSEVSDVSVSAALAGNVTVGTGDTLGFPFAVWDKNEILLVNENGVASTPVINVSNSGNHLGSFLPDTIPDGSTVYTVLAQVVDNTESAYDFNPAL